MLTAHFHLVNIMVTLGRTMHSWKENIKIDLEVLWEGVDWIDLVVDSDKWLAVVTTVMNPCLPSKEYTALWIWRGRCVETGSCVGPQSNISEC